MRDKTPGALSASVPSPARPRTSSADRPLHQCASRAAAAIRTRCSRLSARATRDNSLKRNQPFTEARPSSETVHHIVKSEVSTVNERIDALEANANERNAALEAGISAINAKLDKCISAINILSRERHASGQLEA